MKGIFTDKEELEAEVRNKLTMPFTVLNEFAKGKPMPQEKTVLAIQSFKEILDILDKN